MISGKRAQETAVAAADLEHRPSGDVLINQKVILALNRLPLLPNLTIKKKSAIDASFRDTEGYQFPLVEPRKAVNYRVESHDRVVRIFSVTIG
jgi:hypothetical protein